MSGKVRRDQVLRLLQLSMAETAASRGTRDPGGLRSRLDEAKRMSTPAEIAAARAAAARSARSHGFRADGRYEPANLD